MKILTENNQEFLYDYLNSQYIMSLATTDGLNLGNASIYFHSDKNLNLYYMSCIITTHAKNVLKHPQVALTIFDTQQHLREERIGIQASGICEIVNETRWPKILKKWNTKFDSAVASSEEMKKCNSSFFKIVLTKLKYYNPNLTEKVLEFDF